MESKSRTVSTTYHLLCAIFQPCSDLRKQKVACTSIFLCQLRIYIPVILFSGDFPFGALTSTEISTEPQPWPPLSAYWPDIRSEADRAELVKWYNTVKDKPFIMATEIKKYCQRDTDIARRAMTLYKQNFINITGMHPLKYSSTNAGACFKLFQSRFLPSDSLQVFSERHRSKSSFKAKRWLAWIAKSRGIHIHTALSTDGEKHLHCANQLVKKIESINITAL